jgi:hypothetical protein
MELGSVRSLKDELFADVINPRVGRPGTIQNFAIRATSLARAHGVHRTLAMGVSSGRNQGDFRLAVRVQQRSLDEDQKLRRALEKKANGEIDYRFVGRVSSLATLWHQQRQRPLLIGASVAHYQVTAGSIGGFPTHSESEKRVVLSNNHVLANEGRGAIGDVIVQPGPYDGGTVSRDRIGELLKFVPMKTTGNIVDAAIASIDDGVQFDVTQLRGLATLAGVRTTDLRPGDSVAKVGRTTGVTHGTVTAIELDSLVIDYDVGQLSFDRQLEFEGSDDLAFSQGGDSGSLIIDSENRASSLLFAGSEQGGQNGKGLTYGNPINDVIAALGLVF